MPLSLLAANAIIAANAIVLVLFLDSCSFPWQAKRCTAAVASLAVGNELSTSIIAPLVISMFTAELRSNEVEQRLGSQDTQDR